MNTAVIDVKRLVKNARAIRAKLKGKKFYAVMKADAYGHGAEAVANALHAVADGFCVAEAEEGIALRLAGVNKEILLLTPACRADLSRAISYGITLSVQREKDLTAIARVAKKCKTRASVHLAVNTGMNRFGANVADVDGVLACLSEPSVRRWVSLTGVFSHLYAPESKRERERQRARFICAVKKVKAVFPRATAHLSASGGFLAGKDYDFDGVRVGLMLYGYYPYHVKNPRAKVAPCMTVKTRRLLTRDIQRGEHFLYGEKRVKRGGKYTLVRFGYADGLFRKRESGRDFNRCMDVSAINCEKIPTKSGDFSIFDKNADEIAKKYDTIAYEVLTSVTKRARKEYRR